MKEKHTWSIQVMNELLKHAIMYSYDKGGAWREAEEGIGIPENPETSKNGNISSYLCKND